MNSSSIFTLLINLLLYIFLAWLIISLMPFLFVLVIIFVLAAAAMKIYQYFQSGRGEKFSGSYKKKYDENGNRIASSSVLEIKDTEDENHPDS